MFQSEGPGNQAFQTHSEDAASRKKLADSLLPLEVSVDSWKENSNWVRQCFMGQGGEKEACKQQRSKGRETKKHRQD